MYGHPMQTAEHAFALRPLQLKEENTMHVAADTTRSKVFGQPIHVCTRAQAIEDGVLVDVSEIAQLVGFGVPVALSCSVSLDCEQWAANSRRQTRQDPSGRLWDVVFMACQAARCNPAGERLAFRVYRIPRGGRDMRPRPTDLEMRVSRGEEGGLVITILMPGED